MGVGAVGQVGDPHMARASGFGRGLLIQAADRRR